MYNKNDLKRMFLAGMLFANTNKKPSSEETEVAFEMSVNAFEDAQQSTKSKLTCPSCKSENVFEAVICVNCGTHSAPPTGVCTCGQKPEEHPSKQILAMHHYSFTHHGRVTGCAICEMEVL